VSIHEKNPRDILIAPVVSEKSYGLLDENKYTFVVDPGRQQDRDQDRRREGLRRQGRLKVHTLNRQGKTRRTRFGFGKRKDTKRAIVTLREGTDRHLRQRLLTPPEETEEHTWVSVSTSRRPRVAAVRALPTSSK
jgi:large subunit ribosomal protein L23